MVHAPGHQLRTGRRCKRLTAGHSAHTKFLQRIGHVFSLIRLRSEKHHQRRALLELDERQLSDIGITRKAAEREASRPFWSHSRSAAHKPANSRTPQ
jgi:uncharacterized protein YjiS (DUF1127 family)